MSRIRVVKGGELGVNFELEDMQFETSASCPISDVRRKLKSAGLVPTRQRIAIGWLLFGKGDRHITADTLFEETRATGSKFSLATIYNTLTQFKSAGLIREVATYGGKTWFDTQTGPHYHYFDEEQGKMTDIPVGMLKPIAAPSVPEGMELVGVDVVVRIRLKKH